MWGKKRASVEVKCLFRGSPGKQAWSWNQDGDGADGPGTGASPFTELKASIGDSHMAVVEVVVVFDGQ